MWDYFNFFFIATVDIEKTWAAEHSVVSVMVHLLLKFQTFDQYRTSGLQANQWYTAELLLSTEPRF